MDASAVDQLAAQAAEGRTASSYDQVPYSVCAFPQTHPDRLATIAELFGMHPAAPSRCRVLELGCASGGNLIPIALAEPNSRFVGIDLSARQIADGQRIVRELAIDNVELRHASILEVDDGYGEFDFILAHGVYSWVPADVQEKILRICRRNLSPQGVAYVSYNCYPGWHARGAVREMLWYHTQRITDPGQRIRAARGLLAFLARSAPAADGGYGALIRQELALLLVTPDDYLLHEHLEEFNQPLYFHQFAQRAASHELQYLAEAQIAAMVPARFGAPTETLLRQIAPDLLHLEQYMDFLRNRMFRQTLLCRADVPLDHVLRPAAVERFFIAGDVTAPGGDAEASQSFKSNSSERTLTTKDPLMKAAMTELARRWPESMRFDELLDLARAQTGITPSEQQAPDLATRLLNCYANGQLVEFSLSPPVYIGHATERPVASTYARLRAAAGEKVTSLRLETVPLTDASRHVLRHLDGKHDRPALVKLLTQWTEQNAQVEPADAPPTTEQDVSTYVNGVLEALARAAVLIA